MLQCASRILTLPPEGPCTMHELCLRDLLSGQSLLSEEPVRPCPLLLVTSLSFPTQGFCLFRSPLTEASALERDVWRESAAPVPPSRYDPESPRASAYCFSRKGVDPHHKPFLSRPFPLCPKGPSTTSTWPEPNRQFLVWEPRVLIILVVLL